MSDQLTDRARKAAEEIAGRLFSPYSNIDTCDIAQGGDCNKDGPCRRHVISAFAAIIERHWREDEKKPPSTVFLTGTPETLPETGRSIICFDKFGKHCGNYTSCDL